VKIMARADIPVAAQIAAMDKILKDTDSKLKALATKWDQLFAQHATLVAKDGAFKLESSRWREDEPKILGEIGVLKEEIQKFFQLQAESLKKLDPENVGDTEGGSLVSAQEGCKNTMESLKEQQIRYFAALAEKQQIDKRLADGESAEIQRQQALAAVQEEIKEVELSQIDVTQKIGKLHNHLNLLRSSIQAAEGEPSAQQPAGAVVQSAARKRKQTGSGDGSAGADDDSCSHDAKRALLDGNGSMAAGAAESSDLAALQGKCFTKLNNFRDYNQAITELKSGQKDEVRYLQALDMLNICITHYVANSVKYPSECYSEVVVLIYSMQLLLQVKYSQARLDSPVGSEAGVSASSRGKRSIRRGSGIEGTRAGLVAAFTALSSANRPLVKQMILPSVFAGTEGVTVQDVLERDLQSISP
jgi:hypothetical protein